MSFKSIVRELKEMKDGIGSISRRGFEGKHWRSRTKSFVAPDVAPCQPIEQGQWANLPPELLLDIIRRVEESETAWPARTVVVFCASVCRSWRDITKEIVKTPEECGRLTFPISLKQPGPRDSPIQCFIKRDRATSIYRLYFGLVPSLFSKDSNAKEPTVGSLALLSNFLGTKFTIYDSHPPNPDSPAAAFRHSRRFSASQVSPKLPAYNYAVATVCYELNVLRTRGPRRMRCAMHWIPTPSDFSVGLVLRNKAPRWHEQLQCWCLNFKGRVTVASVKNFQLVAEVEPAGGEQEKVILQFGKIGKDMFTMDYRYPLSAFQAFSICLSSFDTKPACE
ncbi:tubby-like protein 2 [Striga asiatica]|uniref:Tubby-like protein 2 n=1 Tax=Striga asiatica TaxID=4170 RepID=A0A5A7Q513_STRAF|nr:tubby-like protein 2 [Striga asiatica]